MGEHEMRYVYENSRFIYYVTNAGSLIKISKKTSRSFNIEGHLKHNVLIVKIGERQLSLKKLVVDKFSKFKFPNYYCIGHKDKNPNNCSLKNLYAYSYTNHGKKTGWMSKSKPVAVVLGGVPRVYRSVREAAKALYVSYQTLLDFLNGSVKSSVLKGMEDKIYYWKEDEHAS